MEWNPWLWCFGLLASLSGTLGVFLAGFLGVGYGRYRAYHHHTRRPLPDAFTSGVWRAWWHEWTAMWTLAFWHIWARLPHRPPPASVGSPVLLLHGFAQDSTNMWGIGRALRRMGRTTIAPSLGRPFRGIDGYVSTLLAQLAALPPAFHDAPVDVVAHSMGGLVLRRALACAPDLAARIRHVVTLGSPHAGTAAARGATFVREVREMKRAASFLSTLPSFAELAPHAHVTTIAADQDYVVYPEETSHLPETTAKTLRGFGHASLLTHRIAIEAVVAALTTDSPTTERLND